MHSSKSNESCASLIPMLRLQKKVQYVQKWAKHSVQHKKTTAKVWGRGQKLNFTALLLLDLFLRPHVRQCFVTLELGGSSSTSHIRLSMT